MASSHMRMRFQSPMLTTSDTAPMVQKCVLLPTAPKRKASAKAPHTTAEASAAGLDAVTVRRRDTAAGEAVRRCYLLFVARRCFAGSLSGLEGHVLARARLLTGEEVL